MLVEKAKYPFSAYKYQRRFLNFFVRQKNSKKVFKLVFVQKFPSKIVVEENECIIDT